MYFLLGLPFEHYQTTKGVSGIYGDNESLFLKVHGRMFLKLSLLKARLLSIKWPVTEQL